MKPKFLALIVFTFIFFSSVSAQNLSGEPLIFKAYKEVYNRQPNALEINVKNYNSGTWNNYDELKKYVQEFQSSLQQLLITISTATVNDMALIGIRQSGQQIAVAALSLNGGKILANDGAAIVRGTAGFIVSAGGGTLTGRDGSGIAINSKMGGISYGASNILPSENTRIVRSGKGVLIISKK